MGKTTTKENIAVLVSLRFFKRPTRLKEISLFLGVTTRQARNIMSWMCKRGMAKRITHGTYFIDHLPKKAKEVIHYTIDNLKDFINELEQ